MPDKINSCDGRSSTHFLFPGKRVCQCGQLRAPGTVLKDDPRRRIIINLEGGLVQGVVAEDGSELDALVVDYDAEGADESDVVQIPQGSDLSGELGNQDAVTHFAVVFPDTAMVDQLYAIVEAHDDAELRKADPS